MRNFNIVIINHYQCLIFFRNAIVSMKRIAPLDK